MRTLYFILAIALSAAIASCGGGKGTSAKAKAEKPKVQTPYRIDTTGQKFTIIPDSGAKLVLTNIQVYVTLKTQPAVSVRIISPKGDKRGIMLPQMQNMDHYSFGGNMQDEVPKGYKLVIEVTDPTIGKLVNGRLIVMGYNEK